MTPGFGAGLVIPDLCNRRQYARCNREKTGGAGADRIAARLTSSKSALSEPENSGGVHRPTRALANDKLSEWRARGWDVGISTGDVALNLDAKVVVATLETQRGRFLRGEGSGSPGHG